MSLRDQVAEALVEVQMCADTGQPLSAERYADAVMAVVEAEIARQKAATLRDAARHLDVIESASAEELPFRPSPGDYLRARARQIAEEET